MRSRAARSVSRSAAPGPARATKSWEQVVVVGSGIAFRKYFPVTAAAHSTGISLAQPWPYSLYCEPLFLPFDELKIRRTEWFLNSHSFALKLDRTDLEIVVAEDLQAWIQSNCTTDLLMKP